MQPPASHKFSVLGTALSGFGFIFTRLHLALIWTAFVTLSFAGLFFLFRQILPQMNEKTVVLNQNIEIDAFLLLTSVFSAVVSYLVTGPMVGNAAIRAYFKTGNPGYAYLEFGTAERWSAVNNVLAGGILGAFLGLASDIGRALKWPENATIALTIVFYLITLYVGGRWLMANAVSVQSGKFGLGHAWALSNRLSWWRRTLAYVIGSVLILAIPAAAVWLYISNFPPPGSPGGMDLLSIKTLGELLEPRHLCFFLGLGLSIGLMNVAASVLSAKMFSHATTKQAPMSLASAPGGGTIASQIAFYAIALLMSAALVLAASNYKNAPQTQDLVPSIPAVPSDEPAAAPAEPAVPDSVPAILIPAEPAAPDAVPLVPAVPAAPEAAPAEAPERAPLKVRACNNSRSTIRIAGFYQPASSPEKWVSQGWFELLPEACADLFETANGFFDLYAEDASGRKWGSDATQLHCVRPSENFFDEYESGDCSGGSEARAFTRMERQVSEETYTHYYGD